MAFATSIEEAASIESRHERSQKTVQGILDAFVRKKGNTILLLGNREN